MHEPTGVVENLVQILQFTPILQYRIPPPPEMKIVRNLGTLTFQLQNTPPPRKLKLRQILALWDFSVAEYPPPRKIKLRQILALCDFSVAEYPPSPPQIIWNYGRSSQWESLCAKLPHVETLSNPDNYSFVNASQKDRLSTHIITSVPFSDMQFNFLIEWKKLFGEKFLSYEVHTSKWLGVLNSPTWIRHFKK